MRCTIPRRGGTRNWSTSFHLDTAVPDLTTFEDLVDKLGTMTPYNMSSAFYSDINIVGWDYYPAGSLVAIYSKTVSLNGGLTHSTDTPQSSDSVSLWRFSTAARTSKNHPVYLFNYMHGVRGEGATDNDLMDSNQRTVQEALAAVWVTGITVDSLTFKRAGPNGATATDSEVDQYIRHRDFRK